MIRTSSAIAIVGMACRFPKGLDTISGLWKALTSKFNAIDFVPPDRWTADRYFSPDNQSKGKSYIRRGGFLTHDISRFDAAFFGISPRDAENMDPQQRLLLEVVWEAFENAGLQVPAYAGQNVGVYVGGFMLDHMITQMSAANRSQINQNTAAGMMMTMLSNRVSHTFDFRGPSLSIDTACSSSLVAFHYACQDLWRCACQLAVVGGSNVMLRPEYPMGMCKGHFLSRDGECKSFDARADGYGRGEGAAAVILKPLELAVQHRDPILATVIGTGSNQDGHTPGISMPSGEAQQRLIEQVCRDYGIDPDEVSYVECHGTGTAIGDPTEAGAIGATYGAARKAANLKPVVVGSIKSNIGHLEAAAGVAAVVKAVLTIEHRKATPLANLQQPNPNIPLDDLGIRLADDLIDLGDSEAPICVAINSFGYGGSNAHAVLSSPGRYMDNQSQANPNQPPSRSFEYMLPISARGDKALNSLAASYADCLRAGRDLNDTLYSASLRRAHLSHRAVVRGANRHALVEALEALASGVELPNVVRGVQAFQGKRQPVFVFTGMGPQWWAMGQELYRNEPIYRQAVDEADAMFQQIAGFSALAEMLKTESDSRITLTQYAQPGNLMIQIGLLAWLRAAGVEPAAVVGHSVGELASAYAAGVLNLRDVLTVCFHRSRLQAGCAGTGGMLAAGITKVEALRRIANLADRVSIAAVNGPTNITLAGDVDELVGLAQTFQEEGIFHRMLEVEVPYHSPMMDPIMAALRDALRDVRPQPPRLPIYSTVTGNRVQEEAYGADYWPLNVRQSVEFCGAIESLLHEGFNLFVEIGPHPVLTTSIQDCARVQGKECRTVHTLRRNKPEQDQLYRGLMSVHAEGGEIDWSKHNGHGQFVALPNYAWQREHYWLENDRAMQDRIAPIVHPILGIQEAPGSPVWRNDFDHQPVAYLRDHVVTGMPILPAAAYVESFLELAAVQFEQTAGLGIRQFQIHAPMLIGADRGLDSVTSYHPPTQSAVVRGLENGRLGIGQVHAEARLVRINPTANDGVDLSQLVQSHPSIESVEDFYRDLDSMGLSYGPAFQTVRQLRINSAGDQVLTRIEMQPELTHDLDRYRIHPTILDACFQSLIALLKDAENTYLPTGIAELMVLVPSAPGKLWCKGEKVRQSAKHIDCNLTLYDDSGAIVAYVRGMRSTAAATRQRVDRFGDPVKRQILGYRWLYGENLSEPKRLGHWLVVGDSEGLAGELASRLEAYGARVVGRVSVGSEPSGQDDVFVVRPNSSDDFDQVLARCGELDGVLYAQSVDEDIQDVTGQEAIATLICFTQALLRHAYDRRPRVYVATQAAFAINEHDEPVQPRQSAINGLVRVAFNELDGFRFSSIDMPRHATYDVIDAVALELLCDAPHDEVALRDGLRLVSELVDSQLLSDDRVLYQHLDDDHPILVRPLRPDIESMGTARVIAHQIASTGVNQVRLRLEASIVPPDLLLDPTAETIEQPALEFVGRVLEVGSDVNDLQVGQRLCGFVPADLASHMLVDRSRLQVATLDESSSASQVVSVLGLATRAQRVLEQLDLPTKAQILVVCDTFGMFLAEQLYRRGAVVTLLCTDPDQIDLATRERYAIVRMDWSGLSAAVARVDGGFDLLVCNLQSWLVQFDFAAVRAGGSVVDTAVHSQSITLPGHVAALFRSDLPTLLQRAGRLEKCLGRVVQAFEAGEILPRPALEVSLADIAWQKLPLADTESTLVLDYSTHGKDLPIVQPSDLQFHQDATYLITGGFGGFGRKTAEWLLDHGAKHLILTGRTGADNDDRRAFVKSLESRGAVVWSAACDHADYDALQQLLVDTANKLPPLKGVFHSGAVIKDQPIAEMDLPTLFTVMRSKALGAWNLHLLTKALPLDHFVLYSSVANLVGNSRQAAYSAANGFLNGLASYRQSQGLPALSVNWGAIADVGVVAQDEKLEQFLRYTGLRGINSSEGLAVMREGLARGVPQFGVSMITSWSDWARFETRGATSPRFASLIAADSKAADNSARDALVGELSKLDAADQVELLASLMVEIVASVLKSDPADLSLDRSISQFGVDSLMATEIQSLFDSQLGLSISILELIGDTTIRSVASSALKSLMDNSSTLAPTLMANA